MAFWSRLSKLPLIDIHLPAPAIAENSEANRGAFVLTEAGAAAIAAE
jgi:hypothetical protein